jgi:hypothetical protein
LDQRSADDPNDRKIFLAVLRSFEQQIPLLEPPKLVEDWESLYEQSIGWVGVLKDKLVRALTSVFRRNAGALRLRAGRSSGGRISLLENADERKRLRTRLGLDGRESCRVVSSRGESKESDRRVQLPSKISAACMAVRKLLVTSVKLQQELTDKESHQRVNTSVEWA